MLRSSVLNQVLRTSPLAWSLLIFVCGQFTSVLAQGSDPSKVAGNESAFLEDARGYKIDFPEDGAVLELNEKSLLNWTNPVRQQERGAVYVWMHDGRPQVIASLFTYEYDSKVHTKHEFHSLADSALRALFHESPAWMPDKPGIEWRVMQDAGAPANTRTGRGLQIRQLARRYRAELIDPNNEKTTLRLVSRPLLEYSSPRSGVLDGAIFSFAVATDPEVLLLVEAFDGMLEGQRAGGFRYAFARFHYWNVVAYEGDAKRWEAPLDKSHETSELGDRANLHKVYNSFHPERKNGN